MKFLVDESVGIAVSQKLRQMNLDVVSVIQTMKGASDEEVIRREIEDNRVIMHACIKKYKETILGNILVASEKKIRIRRLG